jgi:hypothetical protein
MRENGLASAAPSDGYRSGFVGEHDGSAGIAFFGRLSLSDGRCPARLRSPPSSAGEAALATREAGDRICPRRLMRKRRLLIGAAL